MSTVPKKVYSVSSVRELDRCAIEGEGIAGYTLMTRAGDGLYKAARERYPDAVKWLVVCGAGNNAGDGYVIAARALRDDRLAALVALSDPAKLRGDAQTAYADFIEAGGVCGSWDGALPADCDLIVDAVLGTGLTRDVDGVFAEAIAAMNTHEAPVVAVDIPSGLNGDSGRVMGVATRADMTRSFVGLKAGLFLADGPAHCGELSIDSLGVPQRCFDRCESVFEIVADDLLAELLPKRPRAAHKGDFGHLLVVGGGPGMPGAVRICAEAALRSGSGRVSIATHPVHASGLFIDRPELMCHAIESMEDLRGLLANADVVAFGPGLGRSDWAADVYDTVTDIELPSVWDADALNWLAERGGTKTGRVVTPHPGEAARLLHVSTAKVQADRLTAVRLLRERYGGVAVLKGAGTLVAGPSGPVRCCAAGNPGMASPGMGDALTGIIASLIGQGLSVADAAAAGVYAHALAGDRAALAGERGLLASDVIAELRAVVNP